MDSGRGDDDKVFRAPPRIGLALWAHAEKDKNSGLWEGGQVKKGLHSGFSQAGMAMRKWKIKRCPATEIRVSHDCREADSSTWRWSIEGGESGGIHGCHSNKVGPDLQL